MASSLKMTPVKDKGGKRERSISLERPTGPEELVPSETHKLALLLRVQRAGGWKLEGIAPEVFNGHMIQKRVKQATSTEPLSVDLVNDVDTILELPSHTLVTWVGQELQKIVEWGDYDINVSSLMATRSVILEVAKMQTDMVSRLRLQAEEAT